LRTRSFSMSDKWREFRTKADVCLRSALLAGTERERMRWLVLAEAWRRLVPRLTQSSVEMFEDTVRQSGTGQEASKAVH
jgi:hypothetical protein